MAWSLLVLGFVIGSNNFAVALALGAHGQRERRGRVVPVFGAFEFAIPLLGIWLGATVAERIGTIAGTIGAVLIVTLGVWTIVAGTRLHEHSDALASQITSWRGTILLAAGLSFDNLLVGFSLGLAKANPLLVASTIAVFAVAFTLLGLEIGNASRRHWERRAKIVSGALLIGIGVAAGLGWL